MKKKILTAFSLILVMMAFVLTGCVGNNSADGLGSLSAEEQVLSDSGVLTLKINPEISIRYNEDGVVTEITGGNDDGVQIIDSYKDYIGKDSGIVLEELIALINEAGYFVEEVEGEPKRIVLELEAGSVLPEDQFLAKMTENVQSAVANLDVKTNVVNDSEVMTVEEAIQIAFDHAGVKAEDVHFDDKEFDIDDGVKLYELEFYANGYEYEYDIHAVTGEVLKFERDTDNDNKSARKEAKATQTANQKAPAKKQESKKEEYISMDRAKQIAFEHAGVNGANARFDDQEFDMDDGVPSYELEFDVGNNEYEYDIHAVTGAILDFEHDIEESKPAPKPAAKPAPAPASKPAPAKPTQISRDEAINIALNHAGLSRSQVSFDDVELDSDDGRLIWEIEFESGDWEYEYDIDALTKSILDFEKDFDD